MILENEVHFCTVYTSVWHDVNIKSIIYCWQTLIQYFGVSPLQVWRKRWENIENTLQTTPCLWSTFQNNRPLKSTTDTRFEMIHTVWSSSADTYECFQSMRVPLNHPYFNHFFIGIFHEINHPMLAIKEYPHDYGNTHHSCIILIMKLTIILTII